MDKKNYFNQGHNEKMKELHELNIDFLKDNKKYFPKVSSVLDIGSGSGDMAKLFIKEFNPKHYLALDFDNFLIKQKKIKFYKCNLNNLYEINNFITKFNKKFDCILLFDVLEHIMYFDYLLRNIHKLLKKNGVIIIGLPLDINLSTKLKLLVKNNVFRPFSSVHGHIHLFSYKDVKDNMFDIKNLKLLSTKKCGLGYGLYDKKLHLDFFANISSVLCSRLYLLYKKTN